MRGASVRGMGMGMMHFWVGLASDRMDDGKGTCSEVSESWGEDLAKRCWGYILSTVITVNTS